MSLINSKTLRLALPLLLLALFAVECPVPVPAKFTVKFDADGGSPTPPDQTITQGDTVKTPSPQPTKTNYSFGGWYNKDRTAEWEFKNKVTRDTTLYAKWIGDYRTQKQKAYIPDAIFRAKLKLQFPAAFDAFDSLLTTHTSVADFTGTIDVRNNGITNLSGIEFFPKLTILYCSANQLTSLDVSKNVALKELDCNTNQLTSLDVSQNALVNLWCHTNMLTSLKLNVSQNAALIYLVCYINRLTSLDVSNNIALKGLDCRSNQLTSLDVSNDAALTAIDVSSNRLTSLDVSKSVLLNELYCYSNQLTSLDVSKNVALKVLDCHSNQLTSLDVKNNVQLVYIFCYSNQLTSLDLRGMRYIYEVGITTGGTGINNSGLSSIKVHTGATDKVNGQVSKLNLELPNVKRIASSVQIDSYSGEGTSDSPYTSAICDYDPSTEKQVATNPRGCAL